MAIITQNILTTQEYLEVYPQDANVDTDIIAGSINDATITLDAICGGMIAKVWPVIDPTDPNYRTEEEKNYIKQAHAIQAHEGVCRSVDFTGGSESYTSGSNNYNQSRTTPNVVADEIIYQLLAKARVYNPNITTDTTISGNQGGDLYDPTYDPSQSYITLELGDNRYIHKHAEDLGSANKFLYYDENGNITYVELGEIILDNFYTKEEVDTFLATKQTKLVAGTNIMIDETDPTHPVISATGDISVSWEDITNKPNLYTQEQIDDILENYYTSANVDSILLSYLTKNEAQTTYLSKTEAGNTYATKTELTQGLSTKQDREEQVVLWVNQTPTEAQPTTSIPLTGINDYKRFIVVWKSYTTGTDIHNNEITITPVSNAVYSISTLWGWSNDSAGWLRARDIEFNTTGTITIQEGKILNTLSSTGWHTDNEAMIVQSIIGIK